MEAATGVGSLAGRHDPEAGGTLIRSLPMRASDVGDWPRTTRLLPWLLFGFMATLWIIPFDSILLPFGGPVDMTLDRPFLVLLIAVWFFGASTMQKGRPARASATHWAFGIFTLIAVLSVLANAETLVRLGELELAVKHLALLASYAALFAVAASIIRPS
ncbi:MAG TPA: hypothetical protein VFT10_08125, partial [Solirubrobacterales bacterium]|nr:hypothetical protein [Solirubrobacterales bacterium]